MTKPNFEAMSKEELRAYVLANREDDEAISPEEVTEIVRRKIAGEI
jgi:hypothetical protein